VRKLKGTQPDEAMPGQVQKLWIGGHFSAMLFSFATSSSVQSRRFWLIALHLLNKCRPNPSESGFLKKVPSLKTPWLAHSKHLNEMDAVRYRA
jgi:hypothetical protein